VQYELEPRASRLGKAWMRGDKRIDEEYAHMLKSGCEEGGGREGGELRTTKRRSESVMFASRAASVSLPTKSRDRRARRIGASRESLKPQSHSREPESL
jgi:hypothetical protein